jgi:predicted RNase H-like nuclease (RuvC/YqgF family)
MRLRRHKKEPTALIPVTRDGDTLEIPQSQLALASYVLNKLFSLDAQVSYLADKRITELEYQLNEGDDDSETLASKVHELANDRDWYQEQKTFWEQQIRAQSQHVQGLATKVHQNDEWVTLLRQWRDVQQATVVDLNARLMQLEGDEYEDDDE